MADDESLGKPRKTRVAVVFGGRSAEHEISILSARFVVASLDRDRFEPLLLGIDKDGRWLVQEEALLLGAARDPRLARLNSSMPEAHVVGHAGDIVVGERDRKHVDVVFPVLHGPFGEDGCIQGMLALADIPHVGARVLGSAIGMDKDVSKRLLAAAGLPIVPHVTVRAAEWSASRGATLDRLAGALGFPSFVKPASLGSSVGVSRATDRASLERGIDEAFTFDEKVIVEKGVVGVRELECAVLENEASRVGEIVVSHEDGFYSYAAKYVDEHGVTMSLPANIDQGEEARVQKLALAAFDALECEGMARVDFFRAPDGSLFVNEINTIPGFTSISMYPKLWELSGVPSHELVRRLIDHALERGKRRAKLRTSRT